jgi:hypothetical protein
METDNSAIEKQQSGKLKDRLLWRLFALISFALLYPITHSAYSEWMVFKKGKIVLVTIISVPTQNSPTNFMDFKMDGRIYDKRLSKYEYNDFHAGEQIKLKYLKGYEDFFLFPNENPKYSGIIAILIFVFAGGCCLYYGFKKDPVPFRLPFVSKRSTS